jgi:hypothetical protein
VDIWTLIEVILDGAIFSFLPLQKCVNVSVLTGQRTRQILG